MCEHFEPTITTPSNNINEDPQKLIGHILKQYSMLTNYQQCLLMSNIFIRFNTLKHNNQTYIKPLDEEPYMHKHLECLLNGPCLKASPHFHFGGWLFVLTILNIILCAIWYCMSLMVTFGMTLLMNKWTNIVMDEGWVHPLAKTLPSLVSNSWWNVVMDDWNLDENPLGKWQ